MMSQNRIMLGLAENGSMTAVSGSGIRIMSDSLIAFQPAIEDPSNMMPSRNTSSSIVETCCAVCCHLPRGSVNRRSTYSTECSLSISSTFSTFEVAVPVGFLAMPVIPRPSHWCHKIRHVACPQPAAAGGKARTMRAFCAGLYSFPPEAESGFLVVGRRAPDRSPSDRVLAPLAKAVVADHLDLHLREEIHDVLRAAIKLGMAFLASETLCFHHGDALQPHLVQGFLHLIQFER